MRPLSIVIAHDHEVVRHGIRALLEGRLEGKICGEAATGSEAARDLVRAVQGSTGA